MAKQSVYLNEETEIELDDDLKSQIKMKALREKKSMKQLVTEMLMKGLSKG